MRKVALCFLGTLTCFVLAFLVIRWWVVSHLDFSRIGQVSVVSPAAVGEQIKILALDAKNGKQPWNKLDLSSVGVPGEEAKLLGLRHLIQVFEVGFGRPPKDASELQRRILEVAPINFAQRKVLEEDARDCAIITFQQNSYLLNCDGWPRRDDPKFLVEHFDNETEKFYAVEGHVFLYAPPSSPHPFE
jgi:hypothetical protein